MCDGSFGVCSLACGWLLVSFVRVFVLLLVCVSTCLSVTLFGYVFVCVDVRVFLCLCQYLFA